MCELRRCVVWHSRRAVRWRRFGVDVVAVPTAPIGGCNISGASDICSGVWTRRRWRSTWQWQRKFVETCYCCVTSTSHATSAPDGIQANEYIRVTTVSSGGVSCAETMVKIIVAVIILDLISRGTWLGRVHLQDIAFQVRIILKWITEK